LKLWLTRLCEFSAPTTTNIRTRPTVDVGDNGFELKLALIKIVQASQFVGRHMKMRVPISNTFWRSAALSPSRELPETPYYFASSHSHSWGWQNNGSTPIKIEILHGITAPLPS
jgi:hypothetical protein